MRLLAISDQKLDLSRNSIDSNGWNYLKKNEGNTDRLVFSFPIQFHIIARNEILNKTKVFMF